MWYDGTYAVTTLSLTFAQIRKGSFAQTVVEFGGVFASIVFSTRPSLIFFRFIEAHSL